MTVYMVLEPPENGGNTVRHAERIVFIRDRFSWGAFFLGPLWMLWRRLWLVLLGYVVLVAAMAVGLRVAGVTPGWRALALFLLAVLVGLEAGNLRRWTLRRGGWRELGTVMGDDLEAAERRFFAAYVASGRQRAPAASAASADASSRGSSQSWPAGAPASDVIGLFPEAAASRTPSPGAGPG
jgi:Protein of unknown function (DUF2628)